MLAEHQVTKYHAAQSLVGTVRVLDDAEVVHGSRQELPDGDGDLDFLPEGRHHGHDYPAGSGQAPHALRRSQHEALPVGSGELRIGVEAERLEALLGVLGERPVECQEGVLVELRDEGVGHPQIAVGLDRRAVEGGRDLLGMVLVLIVLDLGRGGDLDCRAVGDDVGGAGLAVRGVE